MKQVKLKELAYARSGDKGSSANVGVIALNLENYLLLEKYLTAALVEKFFKPLGVKNVIRYPLPNLQAFNFVLNQALGEGGSRSLRVDAQGKALGQALLQLILEIEE